MFVEGEFSQKKKIWLQNYNFQHIEKLFVAKQKSNSSYLFQNKIYKSLDLYNMSHHQVTKI
jgi:hypothetical protein